MQPPKYFAISWVYNDNNRRKEKRNDILIYPDYFSIN